MCNVRLTLSFELVNYIGNQKIEIRCTHARANCHHNNAFLYSLREAILMSLCQALDPSQKSNVEIQICYGMDATNFILRPLQISYQ